MSCSSRTTIRRRALIIGLPTLALLFAPTLANSDRGGGKPRIHLKARYTQHQFLGLGPDEYKTGAHTPEDHLIGSFSRLMSYELFIMADVDRRATQRLMRDMMKLKSKAARAKRLKREIIKTQKLIAALKASIKRLKAKSGIGAKLAVKSEAARLERTKSFLVGTQTWAKSPMEGIK